MGSIVVGVGLLVLLLGAAQTIWPPESRVLPDFFPGEQVRTLGVVISYEVYFADRARAASDAFRLITNASPDQFEALHDALARLLLESQRIDAGNEPLEQKVRRIQRTLDDARLAAVPPEDASVVGLAPAGDVEGGAVERHPGLIRVDHRGIEGAEGGVPEVQQFRWHLVIRAARPCQH